MKAKNLFILILFCIFIKSFSFTQNIGCNERYFSPIFQSYNLTTVKYGENLNFGNVQELFMDVYTPMGDVSLLRPVVIFAFGGYYLFGKRSDMGPICIEYAKRGYVAVAIDYRLLKPGTTLNSTNATEAIVRSVQDMKASVRFIKSDKRGENKFKVDTNLIFVGGFSAGSITAIHTAYWDSKDAFSSTIEKIIKDEGGLEGTSNIYKDVSSKVQGVINHSGAILQKNWINANEPLIISHHAIEDNVVPYYSGYAAGIVFVDGSYNIHTEADKLKIPNFLYTSNHGHSDVTSFSVDPEYWNGNLKLLNETICKNSIVTATSNSYRETFEFKILPNPVFETLNIELKNSLINNNTIKIITLTGNIIETLAPITNSNNLHELISLDFSSYNPGIYIIQIVNKYGIYNKKIIKR